MRLALVAGERPEISRYDCLRDALIVKKHMTPPFCAALEA